MARVETTSVALTVEMMAEIRMAVTLIDALER